MPVDPVPTSPTRLPLKSTPSRGHAPVWYQLPSKRSRPPKSGVLAADCAHEKRHRDPLAAVRHHLPAVTGFIEDRVRHTSTELNVASQVEAVSNMLEIAKDFWLCGILASPLPLLFEFFREGVGVVEALRVTAGTRAAVPVPRPADTISGLVDPHFEAEHVAQAVEHVETGKPGAYDDGIELPDRIRSQSPGFFRLCSQREYLGSDGRACLLQAVSDRSHLYRIGKVHDCNTDVAPRASALRDLKNSSEGTRRGEPPARACSRLDRGHGSELLELLEDLLSVRILLELVENVLVAVVHHALHPRAALPLQRGLADPVDDNLT